MATIDEQPLKQLIQELSLEEKDEKLEAQEKTESTQVETDSTLPSLEEVERILGYRFKNKNLLEEAFSHSSYHPGNCFSYERLEYMGDAVLNLLFSKEHFLSYPDLAPGPLTRLRAANVDTEKLARVSIKHGLHRFLRHEKPLLEQQIQKFEEAISEYPLHSNGLVDVPKVLADVVEAIIGAVFIDSNSSVDTVWKVFKGLLEPLISPETLQRHPVSELYEFCQKKNLKVKFVDKWKETTTFVVFIDEQLVGTGTYEQKKEIAHNRAAKDALDNMEKVMALLAEKQNVEQLAANLCTE